MKIIIFLAGCLCLQLVSADPDVCFNDRNDREGKRRADKYIGLTEEECREICETDNMCAGFTYILYNPASKSVCLTFEDLIEDRQRGGNRPTVTWRKVPCQTDASCFEYIGMAVLSDDQYTLKGVQEWLVEAGISAWHCEILCEADPDCIGFMFKGIGRHPAANGCYHIPRSTGLDLFAPGVTKPDNWVEFYRRVEPCPPNNPPYCYYTRPDEISARRDSKFLGVTRAQCQGKCNLNKQCTGYYYREYSDPSKNMCLTYKVLLKNRDSNDNRVDDLNYKIPCGPCCKDLGWNVLSNNAYTLKWVQHWHRPMYESADECCDACLADADCIGFIFKALGKHKAKNGCYLIPSGSNVDLTDPSDYKTDPFNMLYRKDC